MKKTSGALLTTGLRRIEQPNEAKKNEQILPTAEVIMKNENKKRSFAYNRTQKKRVAEGSKDIQADSYSSEDHYEK